MDGWQKENYLNKKNCFCQCPYKNKREIKRKNGLGWGLLGNGFGEVKGFDEESKLISCWWQLLRGEYLRKYKNMYKEYPLTKLE